MATKRPKLMTGDELLQLHSKGVRGELIRGMLSQTLPTEIEHGRVVVNLVTSRTSATSRPRKYLPTPR